MNGLSDDYSNESLAIYSSVVASAIPWSGLPRKLAADWMCKAERSKEKKMNLNTLFDKGNQRWLELLGTWFIYLINVLPSLHRLQRGEAFSLLQDIQELVSNEAFWQATMGSSAHAHLPGRPGWHFRWELSHQGYQRESDGWTLHQIGSRPLRIALQRRKQNKGLYVLQIINLKTAWAAEAWRP